MLERLTSLFPLWALLFSLLAFATIRSQLTR
jgi:hypothetical protein